MQPIEMHLICPSLISFRLGWVDVQPRGTSGESGFRGGDLSVVKSRVKPCLLWLLAAGSGAGQAGVLADGLLACGFLEACVGDDVCVLVFIYVSLLFSSSRGTQMLW